MKPFIFFTKIGLFLSLCSMNLPYALGQSNAPEEELAGDVVSLVAFEGKAQGTEFVIALPKDVLADTQWPAQFSALQQAVVAAISTSLGSFTLAEKKEDAVDVLLPYEFSRKHADSSGFTGNVIEITLPLIQKEDETQEFVDAVYSLWSELDDLVVALLDGGLDDVVAPEEVALQQEATTPELPPAYTAPVVTLEKVFVDVIDELSQNDKVITSQSITDDYRQILTDLVAELHERRSYFVDLAQKRISSEHVFGLDGKNVEDLNKQLQELLWGSESQHPEARYAYFGEVPKKPEEDVAAPPAESTANADTPTEDPAAAADEDQPAEYTGAELYGAIFKLLNAMYLKADKPEDVVQFYEPEILHLATELHHRKVAILDEFKSQVTLKHVLHLKKKTSESEDKTPQQQEQESVTAPAEEEAVEEEAQKQAEAQEEVIEEEVPPLTEGGATAEDADAEEEVVVEKEAEQQEEAVEEDAPQEDATGAQKTEEAKDKAGADQATDAATEVQQETSSNSEDEQIIKGTPIELE